jgi:trans-aconitate methyltransferase
VDPHGDARPDRRGRRAGRRARPLSTPGCLRVVVPAGLVDADVVADACWGLGATAVGESGRGLEVGFVTASDASVAAAELLRRWPTLVVTEVDAGPALQAALEAWLPYAEAFSVGERLRVRPAFVAGSPGDVVVDPTLAFGFDHPSTRLCLDVVASVAGPGSSVLDVGCGSGVLAIAAARLGAAPVVAVDVDPVAVAATAAAAAANGVVVDASTVGVGDVDGRFDLVLANIGARTLVALAPAIAARIAGGGTLVLAGLLAAQVDDVVVAYRAAGLTLASVGEREGWAAPVFGGFPTRIHH